MLALRFSCNWCTVLFTRIRSSIVYYSIQESQSLLSVNKLKLKVLVITLYSISCVIEFQYKLSHNSNCTFIRFISSFYMIPIPLLCVIRLHLIYTFNIIYSLQSPILSFLWSPISVCLYGYCRIPYHYSICIYFEYVRGVMCLKVKVCLSALRN